MDIRQLRYYIAVVEEGTISAAARKLSISQPPLSTQIRLLEEELGVTLFVRGARQITLTPAGRRLYQYALEMTDIERQAKEEIRDMAAGGTGTVRCGCISSGHVREVYAGIRAFHAKFPGIRFSLLEGNTFEIEGMLERNEVEIAFVRTPEKFRDVERQEIRKDPMMVSGTEEILAPMISRPDSGGSAAAVRSVSSGSAVHVRDLRDLPLILYKRWEPSVRECFAREGIEPHVVCVCGDVRTCLRWAENGLGAAVSPWQDLTPYPGMVWKSIEEKSLESTLEVVIRKDAYISAGARALFEIFKNGG